MHGKDDKEIDLTPALSKGEGENHWSTPCLVAKNAMPTPITIPDMSDKTHS